ncbi:MAG: serine O-acetyltransferase [Clostridia bacterium]|nr:serine O-acetyltransferase [Clostridia bacterium]MBQ9993268.1 serine O-acetyltransferase [Clostridia bacterium]
MSSYRRDLINAILEHDPAARSSMEVRLLYPGYKAVMAHRRANKLHRRGFKLLARWISQRAARRTGIEIHPAATIGRGVMIDHGHGVVIGETAVVGDGCMIYQGVTLGGTGKEKGKRHPTLGKNVLVGAGAKVLGPFTVGDNARIAAGAVVLSEVPANATAVGVPAKVVRVAGQRPPELDQIHYDDPVAQELLRLRERVDDLQRRIEG